MTAAIASIDVRTTLLYGSCSVSEYPDVWQCARKRSDFSFFAPNLSLTICAHILRAARILATSM